LDLNGSGVAHVQSIGTLTNGATYMIAGVYDATANGGVGELLLYINGTLDNTNAFGTTLSPTGDPFHIGNDPSEMPLGVLPGRVAQVAFWAKALTATQIQNIYTGGPPGPIVNIGGSQVNSIAGTLNAQQQIGQRGQGSLSVWSALGVTWPYGTRILVQDASGATVYSGYISQDDAYRDPGARQGVGYLNHDLQLMDNAYRADKRLIIQSFLNEDAGDIFADLATNALGGEGVTISGAVGAVGGSVATGVLITEKAFVLAKVSEAFDWLAEQCGYWWMIDASGVAWFQPYGGIPASGSLDGTTLSSD